MSTNVTPPVESLERCTSDLREALQLIGNALSILASVREGADAAAPPAPRVRHAMPSIGPRRPARHVEDEW